jgi:hypothetical protein
VSERKAKVIGCPCQLDEGIVFVINMYNPKLDISYEFKAEAYMSNKYTISPASSFDVNVTDRYFSLFGNLMA